LKELYIYNYLKTYKTIDKWYDDADLKIFYTGYLMIGKLTVLFIYPFYRLLRLLSLNELFSEYKTIFFLLIFVIFSVLDYYFIRKRFDKIISNFDKKSENKVAVFRFYDYLLKFTIVALNLILIFWI